MDTQTLFDALGDPIRRRILSMLLSRDECCVCHLHEALDAPQPKVSRHLAVLRESGLVLARREGVWVHYRLHPELPAWAFRVLIHMKQGLDLEASAEAPAGCAACAA